MGKTFEWLSGLSRGRASSCLVQRLSVPGRQAVGKETGLGRGRLRGAVPPTSTNKGTAPSIGRDLALLLFCSHPSFFLSEFPNTTRCTLERKTI